MPLVGQSRIKIRDSFPSHFPNTTFCLFPPLKSLTSCSISLHLILRFSTCTLVNAFSALRKIIPAFASFPRDGSTVLSRILAERISASWSLFLDTYPIRLAMACLAFLIGVPSPSVTEPYSGFSIPNSTFPRSCMPQSVKPPIPRISPLCSSSDTPSSTCPAWIFSAFSTTSSEKLPS